MSLVQSDTIESIYIRFISNKNQTLLFSLEHNELYYEETTIVNKQPPVEKKDIPKDFITNIHNFSKAEFIDNGFQGFIQGLETLIKKETLTSQEKNEAQRANELILKILSAEPINDNITRAWKIELKNVGDHDLYFLLKSDTKNLWPQFYLKSQNKLCMEVFERSKFKNDAESMLIDNQLKYGVITPFFDADGEYKKNFYNKNYKFIEFDQEINTTKDLLDKEYQDEQDNKINKAKTQLDKKLRAFNPEYVSYFMDYINEQTDIPKKIDTMNKL
jgi:hypothetical protein